MKVCLRCSGASASSRHARAPRGAAQQRHLMPSPQPRARAAAPRRASGALLAPTPPGRRPRSSLLGRCEPCASAVTATTANADAAAPLVTPRPLTGGTRRRGASQGEAAVRRLAGERHDITLLGLSTSHAGAAEGALVLCLTAASAAVGLIEDRPATALPTLEFARSSCAHRADGRLDEGPVLCVHDEVAEGLVRLPRAPVPPCPHKSVILSARESFRRSWGDRSDKSSESGRHQAALDSSAALLHPRQRSGSTRRSGGGSSRREGPSTTSRFSGGSWCEPAASQRSARRRAVHQGAQSCAPSHLASSRAFRRVRRGRPPRPRSARGCGGCCGSRRTRSQCSQWGSLGAPQRRARRLPFFPSAPWATRLAACML